MNTIRNRNKDATAIDEQRRSDAVSRHITVNKQSCTYIIIDT